MSKSTDEDLVFRRRPSLIVTRASTPNARFKPVQDEPTGAESGAPGLSRHRLRYPISRNRVKATPLPGLRTCAGPCLRFGAPIVRDPYPRKAVLGRPTMSRDHGR